MLILLVTLICTDGVFSNSEITTTDGKIHGLLYENKNIIGYLGIPYAAPPVNNLRLEETRKLENRDGIFKANKWPKKCFTFRLTEEKDTKSEDCLYLSILLQKPTTTQKPHLLVVFTNNDFDEDSLLELVNNSLALAVIHFRQGPLAFFASSSPGVTDIRTAIDWLNANKDNFGFSDLTLLAENDDASLLAYALAETKSLTFARAILLNGNTAIRRFRPQYRRVKGTIRLLNTLGCLKEKKEEIKTCLKATNITQLFEAAVNLKYPDELGAPFRPKKPVEDRIYPVLIGLQSSLSDNYKSESDFDGTFLKTNFDKFMDAMFTEKKFKNSKLLKQLAYHHYVDAVRNDPDTYVLWRTTRKLLLDRDFFVPTRNLVFSLAPETNPVYVLEYAVKNPVSTCLTSHKSKIFEAFCFRIWRYFSRFATHGEPAEEKCNLSDPSWPRLKSSKRDYYLKMEENGTVAWEYKFHQSAYAFWNNLVPIIENLEVKYDKKEDKQKVRKEEL